ncbi:DUF7261 family protein [Halarchaeum nitratireducens]|uniref:VCBS repeat-containing protein n=1 Tax=Halarchaeum nitratireducens TaxID=489913 RepID=A0A830GCT5_9EURY|nr:MULTISPECIES: hypothetical protein [Halarchaeum]MBP2250800.1 hypothetical protein [Halarchaeum solikamskense]GGN19016.1 hypothetical protein GCM10009021_20130 [Halarchaeum nitratireducens]
MDEPRGDERGQLILIAGIGIAVALVALALVLNSLVFTQYLATKPTADGSDAIAYERAVEDGVRGLVSEANYREYGPGVDETVEDGIAGNWSDSLTKQYGAHGTLVNVSVRTVEEGTSVHQDDARRFTNASGSGNWTPIESADGVRGFRLTVTNASETSADRPLRVNVTLDGGLTTPVEIYDDGTGVVLNDTTEEDTVSDGFSTPATINFSNGSVDGRETDELAFYDGPNVTQVSIANGDRAVGKYVAVANDTGAGGVTSADDYQTTTDRSPYAVDAVYATTLHATYVGPDVTYETGLRVAPDAFGAGPNGLASEYGVFGPPGGIVFTYNDAPTNLAVTNATGVDPRRFSPTDATVIGPREYDFTGDDVLDTPYVDSSGALSLTNESGTTRIATDVDHTKSLLAVGYWNGTGPSIFYTKPGDGRVYRVAPSENPTVVLDNSANGGVDGVSGIGDVDGDGENELVFVGGSQEQYVYQPEGGKATQISNGKAAQNQGVGASQPTDFDGDGVARVPRVDGSGNLNLVDVRDGTNEKIVSGGVAKSPITAYDIDGDRALEIVYVNTNSHLMYADNVTGTAMTEPLRNATGEEVLGSKATGVA